MFAGPPQNCSILSAESCSSSSIALTVTCFNGNSLISGYFLRFRKRTSLGWENLNKTANNNKADVEILALRDLEANTQYEVRGNKHGYETGSDSYSVMKTVRTAKGG